MSAPKTRGQAIRLMCRSCIYAPCAPGTWRQQVEACTSPECPLYAFRPMPYTAKDAGIVDAALVRTGEAIPGPGGAANG